MKTGKIAENVLIRSVLKMCKTKRKEVRKGAGVGEDCAFFLFDENEYAVTSVHTQVINQISDCNRAVLRGTNNVAVSAGEPVGILINLTLPKKIYESDIKEYMMHIESTCKEINVQIVGGHTMVSNIVTEPIIHLTTIGKVNKDKHSELKYATIGQDIVISKWVGLEGSALLVREKEELKQRYQTYFIKNVRTYDQYLSIIKEANIATKFNVSAMHDASTGGIFSALWELSEGAGVGIEVELKKIPIKQETIEICEYFNVNPYELMSGGALIMVTDRGHDLVKELKNNDINATVIGKIIEGNEKRILNDDEIRYLERPRKDQLDLLIK